MTSLEKAEKALELIAQLHDIKKSQMKYALSYLDGWMENELPRLGDLLGSLKDDLTPDYPDEQRGFNYEIAQTIERGNGYASVKAG